MPLWVLLEMQSFLRIITQISGSNWPKPEIENSFFFFFKKKIFFFFFFSWYKIVNQCLHKVPSWFKCFFPVHTPGIDLARKQEKHFWVGHQFLPSRVYAIISSLLGDVTSVTYSHGVQGLSSVESGSHFSENWQHWSEFGGSSWLWRDDLLPRWSWQRSLQLFLYSLV